MAQHYIALPLDYTVIHLSLLHVLTYTNQVYNRLIATGYANLVQQAVLGFPSTPEKGHTLSKAEVKTENPNRTSSSPKPSPESTPKPRINRRGYFLEKAARARKTASLSANDANDRNSTKTHHTLSEPSSPPALSLPRLSFPHATLSSSWLTSGPPGRRHDHS